jgi:hypothetical protein
MYTFQFKTTDVTVNHLKNDKVPDWKFEVECYELTLSEDEKIAHWHLMQKDKTLKYQYVVIENNTKRLVATSIDEHMGCSSLVFDYDTGEATTVLQNSNYIVGRYLEMQNNIVSN